MASVLLIDDDDDIIQANRLAFEANGHQVTAAHSGQEAWDYLLTHTADVAVLDVMMEEFTAGFTLAQDLHIKFPRLPLVMLTGVTQHMNESWKFSQAKDANWIPVRRFLEKPVPPQRLMQQVEEVLAESSSRK